MEITNHAAVKCAEPWFCMATVSIIIKFTTKFKKDHDKASPRFEFPIEKLHTIWSIQQEQLACKYGKQKCQGLVLHKRRWIITELGLNIYLVKSLMHLG
jgi:hypothetical protein